MSGRPGQTQDATQGLLAGLGAVLQLEKSLGHQRHGAWTLQQLHDVTAGEQAKGATRRARFPSLTSEMASFHQRGLGITMTP